MEQYLKRRAILQKALLNSHLIVPGFGLRYATGSIFYPFHQSTDLLYLTGFNEPNSCLILNAQESILFVQPYDPYTEKWDGKRIGLDGARTIYGATQAYPISQLEPFLRDLLDSKETIFTDLPLNATLKENMLLGTHINTSSSSATHVSKSQYSRSLFQNIKPIGTMIDQFRLFKDEHEKSVMRKSGQIAGRSFVKVVKVNKAMEQTRPGMTEHQLHAILEFESKMQGATGLAYVPVVAGGTNSLILHYVENKDVLKDGDLVLVDCGAEVGFYASDITRTWPVNGSFSPAQRKVYSIVLEAQKELIKKCTVSEMSLDELQGLAFKILQKEMSLLFGRNVSTREMNELYPHHVGHYIGLDVHDTPVIPRSIPFSEGMCVTVEPGIYIPDEESYGEFRGIGIRIEDDVYISKDGPIVLTAEAPKEIVDIEHIMRK